MQNSLLKGLSVLCGAVALMAMGQSLAGAAAPDGVEAIAVEEPLGWATTLKDGRLMSWYREGIRFDDPEAKGQAQKAFGRYSSDGGRTWTEPQLLFEFPKQAGNYIPQGILCDRDGVIHLIGLHWFGIDWARPENWIAWKDLVWHVMSTDGGKTWTKPQYCPFGYRYCGGINWIFQHSSGRILAPLSAYSKRKTGRFVVLMTLSDDGGKTWRRSKGEIVIETQSGAEDSPESGADEPVAVELPDGRVWMSIRTQGGYQYASYSSDAGDTWTKPVRSRFVSSNSAAVALRLKDGRIMYCWSNCMGPAANSYDRQIYAATISADGGKTWKGYREIVRINKVGEYISYAFPTEAPDGTFVLTNDTFVPSRVTRLDPDWLTEPALSDDFSAGLTNWLTLGAEGAVAVPRPDKPGAQMLSLRKPNADVPAGASLNFPFGTQGHATIRLRIEPGFQGARLCLTDHFSLLSYLEDGRFGLNIAPDGRLSLAMDSGEYQPTQVALEPGKWHTLGLAWDCGLGVCEVSLDMQRIAFIPQLSEAVGVCYLRLQSLAPQTDEAGLTVKSVDTRAFAW